MSSHAYTSPFVPIPNWPQLLASSQDIMQYIKDMVDCFDLDKNIHFNHQIGGAWWDEERVNWKVLVQKVIPKTDWASTEAPKVCFAFPAKRIKCGYRFFECCIWAVFRLGLLSDELD